VTPRTPANDDRPTSEKILALLVDGASLVSIAATLGYALKTVRNQASLLHGAAGVATTALMVTGIWRARVAQRDRRIAFLERDNHRLRAQVAGVDVPARVFTGGGGP